MCRQNQGKPWPERREASGGRKRPRREVRNILLERGSRLTLAVKKNGKRERGGGPQKIERSCAREVNAKI